MFLWSEQRLHGRRLGRRADSALVPVLPALPRQDRQVEPDAWREILWLVPTSARRERAWGAGPIPDASKCVEM